MSAFGQKQGAQVEGKGINSLKEHMLTAQGCLSSAKRLKRSSILLDPDFCGLEADEELDGQSTRLRHPCDETAVAV